MTDQPRAPFQILVFPYRYDVEGTTEYALFKRTPASGGFWQGIAGGGVIGESPVQAARRESSEEAQIPVDRSYISLDSIASISVLGISNTFQWGRAVLVIPEYSFGVDATDHKITLSEEHVEFRWLTFNEAHNILKYDSNKVALWELNQRLSQNHITSK